jgi:hypothetical protein
MIVISSRRDSTRAEIAGLSIAYLSPNHKMIDGCIRGKFFGAVLFSDITVAMIRISVMKRATSAVVNVFPEFGLPTITIRLGCGNGAAGFQSLTGTRSLLTRAANPISATRVRAWPGGGHDR